MEGVKLDAAAISRIAFILEDVRTRHREAIQCV